MFLLFLCFFEIDRLINDQKYQEMTNDINTKVNNIETKLTQENYHLIFSNIKDMMNVI